MTKFQIQELNSDNPTIVEDWSQLYEYLIKLHSI